MSKTVKMKFKDAPIGARFIFTDSNDTFVKINDHDRGLVVQWNGNIEGRQSHCCWVDKDNRIDFDTEIELI